MMGFGFGMGAFGFIFMILFWIGLMLLAIWLVSLLFPVVANKGETGSSPSAIEILKKRYARGELTKEEYQEIRQSLQDS